MPRGMYFEEFEIGIEVVSPGRTITEADVVAFAGLSGDFNQLHQCVINLIFNAIDAMPNGGTLNLKGTFDPVKKQFEITVKDTGPGIPQENHHHIFEQLLNSLLPRDRKRLGGHYRKCEFVMLLLGQRHGILQPLMR